MDLKALLELRGATLKKMEDFLAKITAEERAETEEERDYFDGLETAIKDLDSKIEKAQKIEKLKAQKVEEQRAAEGTPSEQEEAEERAFFDYLRGKASENRGELLESENGKVVPKTIYRDIIKAVRDKVPFLSRANVITGKGTISVPVYGEDETNFIDAKFITEGESITDNIGKFTTIDLTGHLLMALALVSRKMIDNTDINVRGFVIEQISEAMSNTLEDGFINGDGTNVKGILLAKNVITTASALAITYDELVKTKHAMKRRFRGRAVWVMNPTTYTAVVNLKDANGQPYFRDDYKVLGMEVLESDSMPEIAAGADVISFIDMSGFTIKETAMVSTQVLREKYADRGMIGILAYGEFDSAITDEKKVITLKMGTV